MDGDPELLAAVLAGGAGERLGGSKATAELAGRPLVSYPLAALAEAGIDAVVVAKADTELPPALPVPVVVEPGEPRHPLLGVATALGHAPGRPVLALACDMPFANAALLGRLAAAGAPAVVAAGGRVHPALALYPASSEAMLREAVAGGRSATAALEALAPAIVEATEEETFNVNTPEDLAYAASIVTRAL